MKTLFKVFVLAAVIVANSANAQFNDNVFFDHIKPPGTLYNNPIKDIHQDEYGLIWFCSNDGLHRYDGYEIKTYRNNNEIYGYGVSNAVNTFYLWNDSTIYIGTEFTGLLKFNPLTGKFSQINFENNDLPSIKQLVKDKTGTLWLNCGRSGLYYLNSTQKDHVVKKKLSLPVNYLALGADSVLYFSTKNTVSTLEEDRVKPWIILDSIESNTITSFSTFDQQTWIGTAKNGIFIYAGGKVSPFSLKTPLDGAINGFIEGPTGELWILTARNGLFRKSGTHVDHFQKEPYTDRSLSSNTCLTAMLDHTGTLWFGTATGINKFDRYQNQFRHYFHKPYDVNSLSDNVVRGLYEDRQHGIWVCTNSNIINILKDTSVQYLEVNLQPFKKILPYSVCQVDKDNFLLGTNIGLLNYHVPTGKFSFNQYLTPQMLDNKSVRQILHFRDSQYLCLSEGRVFVLDLKKGYAATITNLLTDKSTPIDGYQHDSFKVIYTNGKNEVWLGTYGVVAKVSDNFSKIEYFPFEKWQGHMVLSIYKEDNTVWIGTFNGGLVRLDEKTGAIERYTSENGLQNNIVYATIPDGDGHLWLSTNNGISRFNPSKEKFMNFNKEDGLQNQEFNRLAFLKTSKGKIIFGGLYGINVIEPRQVSADPGEAKASLLELTILSGRDENTKAPLKINLIGKKAIVLPYDYNFLQFRYFAAHFSAPAENQFYYKLENFDKSWINAGHRNIATYTGLEPGKYIFKVGGINPDGVKSNQLASLIITIEAPFWKRWWFYSILALSVFAFGFISVKRKMDKEEKVKRIMEYEIESRTKELKKSREELLQLNSKKDFIFSILSHDLRSPLTTLEGFLGVLIANYDTMSAEEVKRHAATIKNSVANSLDLIDNTLYWSLSQMGSIIYTPVRTNLSRFVRKVFSLYELTAERKYINFSLQVEKDLLISADENMIYIVIRNLVSNAIKFTGYSQKVVVKAFASNGYAIVSVVDEGAGISKEKLETLFDQNYTHKEKGTSNEKGTGLGLVLCKKFTDINGGILTVESEPGKGSTFTVKFPLA